MLQTDAWVHKDAANARAVRNRLLETMPPEDFEALQDYLEPIELKKGTIIQDINRIGRPHLFHRERRNLHRGADQHGQRD